MPLRDVSANRRKARSRNGLAAKGEIKNKGVRPLQWVKSGSNGVAFDIRAGVAKRNSRVGWTGGQQPQAPIVVLTLGNKSGGGGSPRSMQIEFCLWELLGSKKKTGIKFTCGLNGRMTLLVKKRERNR